MKGKKKKETEYRKSNISKTRRQSVLKLTPEERDLIPSFKFTEEEIRVIRKQAKKETQKALCTPFNHILIAIVIAIACILYIISIPRILEFQEWALQRDPYSLFYDILVWTPIYMTIASVFAYFYLCGVGIMAIVLSINFISMHFLSREYPRMKEEIQEDLKTELAANRLFAERKARAAVGHDTSCAY